MQLRTDTTPRHRRLRSAVGVEPTSIEFPDLESTVTSAAPGTDVPAVIEAWTATTVVLPRVSVIVPAMNEAENLPHVLPHIPDVHEVILVDGWSTDGTMEVARSLRPDIRIVSQQRRGKGAALCAGFEAATGDIIVTIDADGSTDPREIPLFVEALKNGADFVKGSRFLDGGGTSDMPVYRQLGNFGFVVMVRALYGGRFTDLCYGYNAFWKRVLPALELDADGFEIETMMNIRALRAGLRVAEVPSFESARVYGEGRLRTIPDGMRVLRTILSERVPRRFRRRRIAPMSPAEVVPERARVE